jgi:hypothetical protein
MDVLYFDEPCSFEVKRGVVITSWPSGEKLAFPLDVFRIQLARATKAVAEHDARLAEVVPMRRARRGEDHAAAP